MNGDEKSHEYDNVFGATRWIEPGIFIVFLGMKFTKPRLSAGLEKDARVAFDMLDVDRKNLLTFRDIQVALRAMGWDSPKDEGKLIVQELEKSEKDPLSKQRLIDGILFSDPSV
jgi:hypothetical protein